MTFALTFKELSMESKKILGVVIADQDTEITKRLQKILEEETYLEFLGSPRDIASTMEMLDEKQPNIVIMDINIGSDTSDHGILKLLISIRFKFPSMTIIVLSNSVHCRLNCIAYGADYFFDKSYEFQQIPVVLRSLQTA